MAEEVVAIGDVLKGVKVFSLAVITVKYACEVRDRMWYQGTRTRRRSLKMRFVECPRCRYGEREKRTDAAGRSLRQSACFSVCGMMMMDSRDVAVYRCWCCMLRKVVVEVGWDFEVVGCRFGGGSRSCREPFRQNE